MNNFFGWLSRLFKREIKTDFTTLAVNFKTMFLVI